MVMGFTAPRLNVLQLRCTRSPCCERRGLRCLLVFILRAESNRDRTHFVHADRWSALVPRPGSALSRLFCCVTSILAGRRVSQVCRPRTVSFCFETLMERNTLVRNRKSGHILGFRKPTIYSREVIQVQKPSVTGRADVLCDCLDLRVRSWFPLALLFLRGVKYTERSLSVSLMLDRIPKWIWIWIR